MAWQGEGRQQQIPAKAVFRAVGRREFGFRYTRPKKLCPALAGLTGGFTAMFQGRGASVCPAPCFDKQTAEIKTPLMIAENRAGRGTGKLHHGLSGTSARTALRTNHNIAGL